jgi:hypothetical protein
MFMKVKVEWHSIVFVNMGSLCGLVFGKKQELIKMYAKTILYVFIN